MNEIRFNPPAPVPPRHEHQKEVPREFPQPHKPQNNKAPSAIFKTILKILLAAVILITLGLGVNSLDLRMPRIFGAESPGNGAYSAVFLTNGQVYFGKMEKNDRTEIVLNDVYYLQVTPEGGQTSQQTLNTLNQTRFNLVKLGDELHGPTDELFINRSQVIFYEYLRDDSKVVESIKSQK